ncbi:putative transferase CAF17 homolog, mitochondrial isoform X2 [Amphiura filiformis]|uniref:putative transferase CAF17 homolog, mitochondrial isoform X2 n=1 Tax=Amphiura filiformis TaxID=82378 RepID=UPI003B221DAC
MPPTAAMSRILLNAIRQGIRPPSCVVRCAAVTPSQQHRFRSAAAAELDVQMSRGPKFAKLRDRSILRVAGSDAADLIQGLVPNDVNILNNQKVMYTMFLSSAGRVLYDVMVYHCDEAGTGKPGEQCFLIECDKSVTTDLQRHMVVYRVRKKADVSYFGDKYQVWVVFDPDSNEDTPLTFGTETNGSNILMRVNDPRIGGFAQRVVTQTDVESATLSEALPECKECPTDWYTVHRFRWGVPEGVIDLPPAEALPLESNLAFMNGVSFEKGCYLGQELTARTHHTGVIRKRIMPLEITGTHKENTGTDESGSKCGDGLLTPGSVITTPDGKDAGRARGHLGQYGLGLMRVNVCNHHGHFWCADVRRGSSLKLECHAPEWFGPENVNRKRVVKVVKKKLQMKMTS